MHARVFRPLELHREVSKQPSNLCMLRAFKETDSLPHLGQENNKMETID